MLRGRSEGLGGGTVAVAILQGKAPSGYGDGSGSGYGYGDYWRATIAGFAAKWPDAQKTRLNELQKAGAMIAFWCSHPSGLPANGGGSIEKAAPGVVHKSSGPLVLCQNGTLHATLIPPKWKGVCWWVVALIGPVIGNDEKYGALTREIIGEAL